MTPPIKHDTARRRYSVHIDGLEAFLTYDRPKARHRLITHTIVPDALGGRGLGKALVARFMDDLIAADETVSSSCWFASALIDQTPAWSRFRVQSD